MTTFSSVESLHLCVEEFVGIPVSHPVDIPVGIRVAGGLVKISALKILPILHIIFVC